MNAKIPTSNGLDGQSIGTSKLSLVDGENGLLIICGYSVETLAAARTFEEVSFLLNTGRLPNNGELKQFNLALNKKCREVFSKLHLFESAFELANPMDSLRAAAALLSLPCCANVGAMSGTSFLSKPKWSSTKPATSFCLKSQKMPSLKPLAVVMISPVSSWQHSSPGA